MPFLPPCLHPDCRSAVLRTTWNRFPISVSTYKQKQCPTLCPWAWCFISSLLPSWLLIPWKGWYPGDCFKDRHTEKRDSVSDVLERMKEPTLTLSFSLIHCHYVALQCSQEQPAWQWSFMSQGWQGNQFLLWCFISHLGSSSAHEEANFFCFLPYSSNAMKKKGWGEGEDSEWCCKGKQLSWNT